jgi:hypothetical protein
MGRPPGAGLGAPLGTLPIGGLRIRRAKPVRRRQTGADTRMSTLKLELGAVGRIAGRRPSVFVCHPMKSAGTRCISRRQVGLLGRRLNRTDSVGAAVRGVLQVHSGSHRIRPGRGGPVSARGQELPTLASGQTLSVLSDPPDERDMPTLATTAARSGRTWPWRSWIMRQHCPTSATKALA